jgi:hypothetical protein
LDEVVPAVGEPLRANPGDGAAQDRADPGEIQAPRETLGQLPPPVDIGVGARVVFDPARVA